MALIICDECNREFSDTLTACPHCGKKVLNLNESESKFTLQYFKNLSLKVKIAIGAIIVIIAIYLVSGTLMSSDEKDAVSNCKELISVLKAPDSFKLYGDVEIIRAYNTETDALEGEYMYIDYGATNSYGGMIRSLAAFDQKGYIGDINENLERSDFSSDERYAAYAVADIYSILRLEEGIGNISNSVAYFEVETVSMDKLNKKLGLN